ncbi:MAG: hypothetical protein WDO74_22285 [Pseudomonadota bacterium]
MLGDAYDRQRFGVDIRANSLETFLTIVQTEDRARIPQLVAWHRFAATKQGAPYGDLAASIRSALARLGVRGLVVDEQAEINNSSSGMLPFKKEVPHTTDRGGNTMLTREWAVRGERG